MCKKIVHMTSYIFGGNINKFFSFFWWEIFKDREFAKLTHLGTLIAGIHEDSHPKILRRTDYPSHSLPYFSDCWHLNCKFPAFPTTKNSIICLLYTSDAADAEDCVDL